MNVYAFEFPNEYRIGRKNGPSRHPAAAFPKPGLFGPHSFFRKNQPLLK
jgi:hypothetical protein